VSDARRDGSLESHIRSVPGFPKPGIVFRDISPLLADAAALDAALQALVAIARELRPDMVIAPEARGFLLGPAIAREVGAGFAPARKPGVLPRETIRVEYELEYATSALELHSDAFAAGSRVLVHDDLLATGGTASALCRLVEQLGAEVVGCAFLIELAFLRGRARLQPHEVHALIRYEQE